LSVAAFLRRAGGSMLESTGSHGRGAERRVNTSSRAQRNAAYVQACRCMAVLCAGLPVTTIVTTSVYQVYMWKATRQIHCNWATYLNTKGNSLSYILVIGHVHKLNLGDLDQSRAISSDVRPFVNYLRAIHFAFVNSGAKQSDRSDLIPAKSATKVPRPFVYISSAPNTTLINQMTL